MGAVLEGGQIFAWCPLELDHSLNKYPSEREGTFNLKRVAGPSSDRLLGLGIKTGWEQRGAGGCRARVAPELTCLAVWLSSTAISMPEFPVPTTTTCFPVKAHGLL